MRQRTGLDPTDARKAKSAMVQGLALLLVGAKETADALTQRAIKLPVAKATDLKETTAPSHNRALPSRA